MFKKRTVFCENIHVNFKQVWKVFLAFLAPYKTHIYICFERPCLMSLILTVKWVIFAIFIYHILNFFLQITTFFFSAHLNDNWLISDLVINENTFPCANIERFQNINNINGNFSFRNIGENNAHWYTQRIKIKVIFWFVGQVIYK